VTGAQRPRRSLTSAELRTWRDFIETVQALHVRLEGRLQSESSLSQGDYQVLLALSEAGGHRMRPSELAAVIGWERSRLSHHLGRMEKRGLIGRDPCAADGRGAEVVLAAHGSDCFRRATIPHLRAVRELFIDALTQEQLAAADDIVDALRRHLDQSRKSARENPAAFAPLP
jgi:DNA-binding MarR family transcriptional regulator